MDETVPMLYRSYPRSLDRLTLFADVMTKVVHSPLLLFKTLCVGPVWPLHQKRLSLFQQTVVRPKKGAVTKAKEEKSSWARRNSESGTHSYWQQVDFFFPSWETWPERSWVLTDTARECSHACRFWEGVFSLEKMGVIKKKRFFYRKKTCDCDFRILNFFCHEGIPETTYTGNSLFLQFGQTLSWMKAPQDTNLSQR